jgi:peptide/nickel transport system substrate-binding protein
MRTRLLWLPIFVLVCLGPAMAQTPDPAGVIRVGHAETVRSMDPQTHTSITDWEVHFSIWDPLVYLDAKGNLVPALATRWENPDPTTYVFHLRRNVKFHDGQPFTAADVKFTLDRLYDPKTASPQLAWWPKPKPEITVVDDYTIRLKLQSPYAPLLRSFWLTAILPHQAGARPDFLQKPIGTGPFKFVEYVKGDRFIADRFDGYWNGRPKAARVHWRIIPEASARVAALEAGEIDLIPDGIPPEEIARIKGTRGITVQEIGSVETRFLVLNNAKPPFNDKRVRQAIWYALDVKGIVEGIMLNSVGVQRAPMSSHTFGYPAQPLPPHEYNPEKAKQLLREAGLPNGFTAEYLVYSNNVYAKDDEVAQAIQAQLGAVGIKININMLEIATALAKVQRGEFEISKQGCAAASADFSLCAGIHYMGPSARNRYNNPRVNELLAQGLAASDPQTRLKAYEEVGKILAEDAPNVWLFDNRYSIGVGPRLQGVTIHPTRINAIREQAFVTK